MFRIKARGVESVLLGVRASKTVATEKVSIDWRKRVFHTSVTGDVHVLLQVGATAQLCLVTGSVEHVPQMDGRRCTTSWLHFGHSEKRETDVRGRRLIH